MNATKDTNASAFRDFEHAGWQTAAARDAIRASMRDKTAGYAGASGIEMPMPCVPASAVKR